jgi:hypothetical protein
VPRVLPAGLVQIMKTPGGCAPIKLLDIQTRYGTCFYFSDFAGTFPVKLGQLKDNSAFDAASWIPGTVPVCTVTPNVVLAPDGTLTGDQLNLGATGPGQFGNIFQDITPWGINIPTRLTFSVWLGASAPVTIFTSFRNIPPSAQNDIGFNVDPTMKPCLTPVTFPAASGQPLEVVIYNPPSSAAKTIYAWNAQILADYRPWIKSIGPFNLSRSLATDAGEIMLQNISGNTIERDFAKVLANQEMEGALAIFRLWNPLLNDVMWEMHGTLSEAGADEIEGRFRFLQLMDASSLDVPYDIYSEKCTWRYKSPQCGSASGLATCDKTFANCQARNATERFNGILNPSPQDLLIGGGSVGSSFSGGPDRNGGPVDDGTGARLEIA